MSTLLPVVLVNRNGKQFLRAKPARVKQTPASIRSAGNFAVTSALTRQILLTLSPIIQPLPRQRTYHRLLSALLNWKQQVQTQGPEAGVNFCEFRFNTKASFTGRLGVKCQALYREDSVAIHIPGFVPSITIAAPAGCSKVLLDWVSVSCLPFQGEVIRHDLETVQIDYNSSLHQPAILQLGKAHEGNCLTLVAAAIRYDNIQLPALSLSERNRWVCGGIISGQYAG